MRKENRRQCSLCSGQYDNKTMASIDNAIDLINQKLVIGLATLLISLLFGLLPYHLSRTANETTSDDTNEECCTPINNNIREDPTMPPPWLSLATSFGGGVFLGAAMLHLLPEASEVLDNNDNLSIANFICCLGFLAVLGLEEMMPSHSTKQESKSSSSSLALVVALSFHSMFDGLAIGSTTSPGQLKAVSIAVLAHKPISAFALGSILVCKQLVSRQSPGLESKIEPSRDQDKHLSDKSVTSERRQKTRRLSSSGRSMAYYYFKYARDDCENGDCSKKECVCNDLMHGNHEVNGASSDVNTESLHLNGTSNEGYGSYQNDVQTIKPIQTTETSLKTILYIIFFSTTSLLGTIIGAMGLQCINNSHLEATVAATCQSFAAGSFLYAATMEALVKETGDHHRHHYHHQEKGGHVSMVRTNRVGVAFLGVLAMASIKFLEHGE